jgi:hopanoid biosynthesis associated RND transporter like protein HpnN
MTTMKLREDVTPRRWTGPDQPTIRCFPVRSSRRAPMLNRVLAGVVDASRRHAVLVVLAGIVLAVLACAVAATRLGVTTDTDQMFSASLPWRRNAIEMNKDFPQFHGLLVAVIDAREPEQAEATAAALADALSPDNEHFSSVRRPDASPYFETNGLLFLDVAQLTAIMDQTIDAQPFLGQLVADPTARGLFSALALLGVGVTKGAADLTPYLGAIRGFHTVLADVLEGKPRPLSWQKLLGGGLSDLAGQYRFVLFQPRQNFGTLQPGGEATTLIRQAISQLEFVKSGDARVRITGQVALADEEFSTVAQGAVKGLIGSVVLITLWLFLAVRTWRLIVPILLTLALGLVLTLLFASVAVGTLNLVSVGFGVMFVGIAVDFAIQFSVRYREYRHRLADPVRGMKQTGALAGVQILCAALATAAGFLAFVPTAFSGVAELGLIAGGGMLIAFVCTMTFLPAAITLFKPQPEGADIGFSWAAPLDPWIRANHAWLVAVFIALAGLAMAVGPRLTFDSNPLDTKNPNTEAMRTLRDLIDNPLTNPYSIDIVEPNVDTAVALAGRLRQLPTVAQVRDIESFVPQDQDKKLAVIADARALLAPTLSATPPSAPITPDQVRMAAGVALAQIDPALVKLPKEHPLAEVAADLRKLRNAPDAVEMAANAALTEFLPLQLRHLRESLQAHKVTLSDVPPDISRDWVLPDGRARLQVLPKPQFQEAGGLTTFTQQVTRLAPDAGGSAVIIADTSATIVHAFRTAAISALLAILVILTFILRRPLDVALVMAPLVLSALLTLYTAVLLGMPLNFANVIALPLLLGVGVSFNVYFIMNWRAGLTAPLASATARAVLFSALTTGTAFGSLALSAHPGTASMGVLLLISLGCTLIASLIFVPAVLAVLGSPRRAP